MHLSLPPQSGGPLHHFVVQHIIFLLLSVGMLIIIIIQNVFHTLKIILKQYKISREKTGNRQTSVKRGSALVRIVKSRTSKSGNLFLAFTNIADCLLFTQFEQNQSPPSQFNEATLTHHIKIRRNKYIPTYISIEQKHL